MAKELISRLNWRNRIVFSSPLCMLKGLSSEGQTEGFMFSIVQPEASLLPISSSQCHDLIVKYSSLMASTLRFHVFSLLPYPPSKLALLYSSFRMTLVAVCLTEKEWSLNLLCLLLDELRELPWWWNLIVQFHMQWLCQTLNAVDFHAWMLCN